MGFYRSLVMLGLMLLAPAACAQGTSFCNTSSITIQDNTTASVYPAGIAVSGLVGKIASVSVTIDAFSHSSSSDVGMVLVGPGGQSFLIQDGAGSGATETSVTYTLSDAGVSLLPQNTAWSAGTYKPTSYVAGDSFASPGPGTSYSSSATAGTSTFETSFVGLGGAAMNGTWNLYVADFQPGGAGSIAGGWCVNLVTALPVTLQSFSVD